MTLYSSLFNIYCLLEHYDRIHPNRSMVRSWWSHCARGRGGRFWPTPNGKRLPESRNAMAPFWQNRRRPYSWPYQTVRPICPAKRQSPPPMSEGSIRGCSAFRSRFVHSDAASFACSVTASTQRKPMASSRAPLSTALR